jgi:hypothetical protein
VEEEMEDSEEVDLNKIEKCLMLLVLNVDKSVKYLLSLQKERKYYAKIAL